MKKIRNGLSIILMACLVLGISVGSVGAASEKSKKET